MYFALKSETPLRECGTVLREYTHESGARLIWFDNGAEEKAFAAAFRTIPEDSTGVFHILEHSVLAGSEHYPVASPILYMMKNSMQTYLNALTFQDKTMYPVASCNAKDFENLMRVYLDAVFMPKLSEDVFMREGWHLEKAEDGYAISGVVFNEMKGAMSSVDSILYHDALADYAPDTYLSHNSGGHPDAIPTLTYEQYLAAYRSYYSTHNCVLFLSGKLDPDRVFPILDEWLGKASQEDDAHGYDPMPTGKTGRTHTYAVPGDDASGAHSHLALTYDCGAYEDEKRAYAVSILVTYLLGDATSALKKRLIESGLCGNVEGETLGYKQNALFLAVNDIEEKDRDAILALISDELTKQAAGMDHEKLSAILENDAFNIKEQLSLLSSQAVESFITMANNVFYGAPLSSYFEFDPILAQLRAGIEEGYYERLLREVFLDNPHTAVTTLVPERKDAAEENNARIEKLVSSLSDEELREALRRSEEFLSRAQEEDTPEQIAQMPRLSLSDLDAEPHTTPLYEKGDLLLTSDLPTAGIVYARLYFNVEGMKEEELSLLPLLGEALGQISTKKRNGEALSTALRAALGRFSCAPTSCGRGVDHANGFFTVNAAFLREKGDEVRALLSEVLNETVFLPEEVVPIVRQETSNVRNNISYNSINLALATANAGVTRSSSFRAAFSDYAYLTALTEGAKDPGALCRTLASLCRILFVHARLTVGITGREEDRAFVPALPEGTMEGKTVFAPHASRIAFPIRSEVSYNVQSVRFDDLTPYDGRCVVIEKLFSLGYLWHKLRETGGAYGTGMIFSLAGSAAVYSYRDPVIRRTYEVFEGMAPFFRETEFSREEIEGCIISAAADYFKPKTAEQESAANEIYHFVGFGPAEVKRLVSEILAFDPADPETKAVFDAIFSRFAPGSGSICTVGSSEAMEKELFDEFHPIGD